MTIDEALNKCIARGEIRTAKAGDKCPCGRPAELGCGGCDVRFCRRHWWLHSHTTFIQGDIAPPAVLAERPGLAVSL